MSAALPAERVRYVGGRLFVDVVDGQFELAAQGAVRGAALGPQQAGSLQVVQRQRVLEAVRLEEVAPVLVQQTRLQTRVTRRLQTDQPQHLPGHTGEIRHW